MPTLKPLLFLFRYSFKKSPIQPRPAMLTSTSQPFSQRRWPGTQLWDSREKGERSRRARERVECSPLPSAAPRPQSCPPWRCHRGYTASCAVHTFWSNAGERKQNTGEVPTGNSGGQHTRASPEFQVSHGEPEETCAFQTPVSIKPSKRPKMN